MLTKNHYYPILKWKKGEQAALKNFTDDQPFIPVIELVDKCDPAVFFNKLKACRQGPIFFDTVHCDDDKRTLLFEFIDYCRKKQINAWPLIYVNDVFTILKDIATKTHDFAVKLPVPEEFGGPTNKDVLDTLDKYNIADTRISLFFDAGVIVNSRDANHAFADYRSILTSFTKELMGFQKVIICLTSFPETISIVSGANCQYNRFDIKIFTQLLNILAGNDIVAKLGYADYGVTKFTDSEIDFKLLKYGILPKVKYTTHDFYFVSKGKKDRTRGIYIVSYKDIANQIVNSSFYFGKDFSFGDSSIYEKATITTGKTGGPTNWVSYCANHHIAVLIEQLSTLLGS